MCQLLMQSVLFRDLHGFGNPCGLRVRVRVTVWVPVTRAQPATMPDVRQLGWVEVIFMSRVTH